MPSPTPTRGAPPANPPRIARTYAYIRYSSDGQEDGNSIERQRDALRAELLDRLAELDVKADDIVWLEDRGLSAFHGEHMSRGALGEFLQEVREGRIPQNSLFACETVSRASRQGAFSMLGIISAMLDAGMYILVLRNGGIFNKDTAPRFLAVELAVYAELAREESALKQHYSLENWRIRRKRARANPGQMAFTRECPRWLQVVDGRYQVIEEKAESIRKVFALALDGFGVQRLVGYCNENRLPVPGKGDSWHISLIKRVLENRAVIGEFQPYTSGPKGTRVPDGAPIENFFPPIIESDTFFAVQALRSKRKSFPKRNDSNNHNYLLGLAKCACGGTWRWLDKNHPKQPGYSQYSCSNRERKHTKCPKVNGRVFDFHFISWALGRIPEMLASGSDPRQENTQALEGQLASVTQAIERIRHVIETNDDLADDLLPRYRELRDQSKELTARLDAARLQAIPEGFSFDEAAEVFIPAFIDYYAAEAPEAEDAYRARSIFKARVAQAVESVLVSIDRTNVTVTLRNGVAESFSMDPKEKFSAAKLDPEELAELEEMRAEQLQQARRISNSGLPDRQAQPD